MHKKKMTVKQMAEKIYVDSDGASASELASIVSRVMERNGDNPSDLELRKQIGVEYKNLFRASAA